MINLTLKNGNQNQDMPYFTFKTGLFHLEALWEGNKTHTLGDVQSANLCGGQPDKTHQRQTCTHPTNMPSGSSS